MDSDVFDWKSEGEEVDGAIFDLERVQRGISAAVDAMRGEGLNLIETGYAADMIRLSSKSLLESKLPAETPDIE